MTAIPYHTPGVHSFKDRSTMLLVVGIFLIIGGVIMTLATIAAPMTLMLPRPAATPAGAPLMPARPPLSQILVSVASNAMFAVVLGTLGIGAIRKRRWVRPIMLVLATIGLIVGIGAIIFLAFMLPDMMQTVCASMPPPPGGGPARPPPQFVMIIMAGSVVFAGILYIVVPALLIYLFKGPDVQATLEFYDPVPRWTDAAPIGVLGFSTILVFGAFWALMMSAQGMVPAFGVFLDGMVARAAMVIIAALLGIAAVQTYRLRRAGWGLAVALLVVSSLSSGITLYRADLGDFYRRSGVAPEHMEMVQIAGRGGVIWSVLLGVGSIIYALRIRKHFDGAADVPGKLPA